VVGVGELRVAGFNRRDRKGAGGAEIPPQRRDGLGVLPRGYRSSFRFGFSVSIPNFCIH